MTSTAANNYNSIDVAKMMMALLVVGLHVHPLPDDIYFFGWWIYADLSVPFFFITSSYFFFLRKHNSIKRYLTRMGKLYLFWLLLTLPLTVIQNHLYPLTMEAIWIFVQNFFLGSTFRGSWFLMALMISVPLIWCLARYMSNKLLLLLGIATWMLVCSYKAYASIIPYWLYNIIANVEILCKGMTTCFLAAIIFVVLGKCAAENMERIRLGKKTLCLLFISSFIIYLMESTNAYNNGLWGG